MIIKSDPFPTVEVKCLYLGRHFECPFVLKGLGKLEFKGLSGDTAQILIVLINELTRGVVDVAALEFASTFKTWTTRVAKSISLMSVVGIKEPYLS